MEALVARRDLNILAKRLDRLVDKLNDNNVITAYRANATDPSSWSLHITFREGGSVMRALSADGRRVCVNNTSPGGASIPMIVGSIHSLIIVDIYSYRGVIGYNIKNGGDACCRATRRLLVALPTSISRLHTMRGEWLSQILPEAVSAGTGIRYIFSKADAQSFLASLVTCKHTYKEIIELVDRYLHIKLKQELKLKLIGEITK